MRHEEAEMLANDIELERFDMAGQANRFACQATRDALLRALPDPS